MSGTSAFVQHKCLGDSSRKISGSTSSKIEVGEFESLIRGQGEILSTKESALEKKFCSSLSSVNQFGTKDSVKVDTLEVSAL